MPEETKQEKKPVESEWGQLLTLGIGIILTRLLEEWAGLPAAESVLAAWSVAIIIGYWLPPRPSYTYKRCLFDRFIFLLSFYLAIWKIPAVLRLWIYYPVALGVSIFALCISLYWQYHMHKNEQQVSLVNWVLGSFVIAMFLSTFAMLWTR